MAGDHESSATERTLEMCTPSERWMPQHSMQTSVPYGSTAHVGSALSSPQSAHAEVSARLPSSRARAGRTASSLAARRRRPEGASLSPPSAAVGGCRTGPSSEKIECSMAARIASTHSVRSASDSACSAYELYGETTSKQNRFPFSRARGCTEQMSRLMTRLLAAARSEPPAAASGGAGGARARTSRRASPQTACAACAAYSSGAVRPRARTRAASSRLRRRGCLEGSCSPGRRARQCASGRREKTF
mmetsp:Transcript_4130/g.13268  ORF Transcript_4130/g.13268 Transcript_4130/m.13268 type:complete len:247 (-) Transcript_4130:90-830(-)